MSEAEIKRLPIILIKNVVRGVETLHNRLNVLRFTGAKLDKGRYLNLYDDSITTKWTSCIECDIVTFNQESKTLIYWSKTYSDSYMVYEFSNLEDYLSIRELFNDSAMPYLA